MSQLSSEDSLRLNVLLAQDVQAVRIDENHMTLYALSDQGEARVELSPTGRAGQYLKQVREFLSGHVLGSPGGYPLFMRRWTRMGQTRHENLGQLLMLGEPEAVMAVVHDSGLTPEVAELAWWCMPESENARCMLARPEVAASELGPVLAQHLYEHLAFETEPAVMIRTVRLMLQPGLISDEQREKLWRSSQRKNACLVGFLQADADGYSQRPARHDAEDVRAMLQDEIARGNPVAEQLQWLASEQGQGYLETVSTVMKKPANQDVVSELLNTLQRRFRASQPFVQQNWPRQVDELETVLARLHAGAEGINEDWRLLLDSAEALQKDLIALAWLAHLSDEIVTPIFAQTTAEGTLMRKKLAPVLEPVLAQIEELMQGSL